MRDLHNLEAGSSVAYACKASHRPGIRNSELGRTGMPCLQAVTGIVRATLVVWLPKGILSCHRRRRATIIWRCK